MKYSEFDLLKKQEWKANHIKDSVSKMRTTLNKIDEHTKLTPQDWENIIGLTNSLFEEAKDLHETAIYEHQHMIS